MESSCSSALCGSVGVPGVPKDSPGEAAGESAVQVRRHPAFWRCQFCGMTKTSSSNKVKPAAA